MRFSSALRYCALRVLFLRAVFLVFLAFLSEALYAQNDPKMVSQPVSVVPVSPNAASLGKFSEIPVAGYTGIPDISIPIWQIKSGDIQLPIALSYHAGGIKVDEIASWVGTGWALNAGGVISRSPRGLPDTYQFYDAVDDYYTGSMTTQQRQDFLVGVFRGNIDAEPDIYHLNMGGISCKFFMGTNGAFIIAPRDQNIKIEENVSGYDWIITDPNGIKYKFDDREYTESEGFHRIGSNPETSASYSNEVSSWYLTQIEDNKGNTVNFTYTTTGYSFYSKATEKVRVAIPNPNFPTECQSVNEFYYTDNNITGKRLQSISYKNGELLFTASGTQRSDQPGDYALQQIEIRERGNSLKKFKFFTSYFSNNNVGATSNVFQLYSSMDQYRLKLDSVREESSTITLPPYKFTYETSVGLPYRMSNAQDHWGYYNGQTNTSFVTYRNPGSSAVLGAQKGANATYATGNILTQVTYPTGGSLDLEYEGNRFMTYNPSFTYSNQVIATAGGNNGTSNYEYTYSQGFVINQALLKGDASVTLTPDFDITGVDINCSCTVQIFIEKSGSPNINLQEGVDVTLGEGSYTLKVVITNEFAGNPPVYAQATLSGQVRQAASIVEAAGPGMRVKKMTNQYGGGQTEIRRYEYLHPVNATCSGLVGNHPDYVSFVQVSAGSGSVAEYTCDFNVFSSSSNYPLLNTKSAHIGYSFVTEYRDASGGAGGKRVSEYTNYDTYNDINPETFFPYVPSSPQDWKRGLLKSEKIYEYNGSSYALKQKTGKKYEVLSGSPYTTQGVKVGAHHVKNYTTNDGDVLAGLSPVTYPLSADVFTLTADTLTSYDGANAVERITTYSHASAYYQVTGQTTTGSDIVSLSKSYLYPYQMVAASRDPNGVYAGMIGKNMLNPLIEEITYKNSALTGLQRTNFAQPYSGIYLPESTEARNLVTSADETRVNYHTYDSQGNPLSVSQTGGPKTIYVWSYNGQYPVAEIKNAELSAVVTALGGQGAVDTFRASTTPNVSSFFSGLRAALPGALITIYTYIPWVGMSSMTDPKGMTTTYEYDTLQRLVTVKDHDGNVVKTYQYNYKQ